MKFLSLFRSHHYKPSWVYRAKGQLWRILFSHGDLLAGEFRNNTEKRVTFFCLDIRDGRELWTLQRDGEGWWTTTEGIYGKNLYLHAFAKPDLPHPRHVTSIDIESGNIIWEQPEMTFLYAQEERVVVEKRDFGKTQYFRLDPGSGAILETIEDVNLMESERREARANDPHIRLIFPEVYTPGLEDHHIFHPIVETIHRKRQIVDPIEVSRYGQNLVVCYHTVKDTTTNGETLLTHELIISNAQTKELYRDVLYDNAFAPVPDGFFIREGVLFYVRNKSELVALTLQNII